MMRAVDLRDRHLIRPHNTAEDLCHHGSFSSSNARSSDIFLSSRPRNIGLPTACTTRCACQLRPDRSLRNDVKNISTTRAQYFKNKNLNASRPSEHPLVRGGKHVKTFRWDHRPQIIQNLFMVKTHNNKGTQYAANHSMIKNAIYKYSYFHVSVFPPPRSAKKHQFGCESPIGVRRSTVVLYLILRVFSYFPFILDIKFVGRIPAGVTQEGGHTEVVSSVRKVVVAQVVSNAINKNINIP